MPHFVSHCISHCLFSILVIKRWPIIIKGGQNCCILFCISLPQATNELVQNIFCVFQSFCNVRSRIVQHFDEGTRLPFPSLIQICNDACTAGQNNLGAVKKCHLYCSVTMPKKNRMPSSHPLLHKCESFKRSWPPTIAVH